MDSLKEEDREINHHGSKMSTGGSTTAIQVRPADSALVARREDVDVQARKKLYEQLLQSNTNKAKLATCRKVGRVYIPVVVGLFASVYWGYGLSQMT